MLDLNKMVVCQPTPYLRATRHEVLLVVLDDVRRESAAADGAVIAPSLALLELPVAEAVPDDEDVDLFGVYVCVCGVGTVDINITLPSPYLHLTFTGSSYHNSHLN